MAKAYWIATYRSIKDPAALDAYAKLAGPAIGAAGGRIVVRGTPTKTLEAGLDLRTFGPPIVAIYLASDVGSIAGGWLSSNLMKRGRSLASARKTAMLICALCALPVAFATQTSDLWVAVAIIGLAAAAHQGFSANLYTFPGDVFPRSAVATVIGIGGMLGGIGGMVFAQFVGRVLQNVGNYTPIFLVAGSVYLIALLVVHLLSPQYKPVQM